MPTLLDSLTSLAAPATGLIAQRLGETETATSRGMQASLAAVLGGITSKAGDAGTMRQVLDVVRQAPASANLGADAQKLATGLVPGAMPAGPAGTLLDTLFGGRMGAVGDAIARTAGFRNTTSGSSLLAVAAPLVLGLLGTRVREGGMNAAALANLLAGERQNVLANLPAGLTNLMGGGLAAPGAGGALRGAAQQGEQLIGQSLKPKANRFWPVAAVLAVAIVAWLVATRDTTPMRVPTVALETAAARTGAVVQAGATEAGAAAGKLGAFVRRALPGGVELNVPSNGIESKLVAFIEDRTRPVNDTTWFDFDRLNFASGSATVLPESREQLDNIVAVLKAYPNVHGKIGGYTDNVGNAAANLRLSQRRADAVMQALVQSGVPASRLQAEGYGDKHPVADNSTEDGRARNRRIALKVTRK